MGKLNQHLNIGVPALEHAVEYIERNAEFLLPMLMPGQATGRHLILAGNGRQLADHVYAIEKYPDAEVWGCNGAAIWLREHGIRCDVAYTNDSSERMYENCWADPPDMKYYVASSVDPRLIEHLLGHGREVWLFHSWTGTPGAFETCYRLYPHTPDDDAIITGLGLNSVNRAFGLARVMGFERFTLLGCVSHLDPDGVLHADGGKHYDGAPVLEATIEGRPYRTLIDFLASALDLVKLQRLLGDRLEFIGDPNSLQHTLNRQDDEFLRRIAARQIDGQDVPIIDEGLGWHGRMSEVAMDGEQIFVVPGVDALGMFTP